MTFPISPPQQAVAAELLIELSSEIEELGVMLCRDPEFARYHMRELQAIDLIAQKQRCIVELLSAHSVEDAFNRISLEQLKARIDAIS